MRRRIDKTRVHRVEDFVAAIGLTFLIVGFVAGLVVARLADFGADCGGR